MKLLQQGIEIRTPDNALFEIRCFDIHEVNDIYELERQANPFPWSKGNLEDSVNSSHICVGVKAMSSGAWVAYAVFSLAAGEAELLIIAVHPAKQGKGLAKAMLRAMEGVLAEKADQFFLEVRQSNTRAIQLYEALEFNQLGVRPNYYPGSAANKREDALIYGKYIG